MADLANLARTYADLEEPALAHLHRLVGQWQLLADLSFADLLLFVRARRPDASGEPRAVIVAQLRPLTGPTMYAEDLVGSSSSPADRFVVDRAFREGRIVRDGEPEWRDGVPVREEAIPVTYDGRVIAVLARDTNLATARSPSALELAYLAASSDLAQMVAEGRFPHVTDAPELPDAPRVGDGLLRLDADGLVTFASPNALSAVRRMGYRGNLAGHHLADVRSQLSLDMTAGQARVELALERREPVDAELVSADGDTAVRLRAVPLLPGGALLGAVVVLRDVSDVRRRDRALLTKDATIREIHHRVKNNLQTVAALLRLQARRTDVAEAREALAESVRRVTSIAVVHETLSTAIDESVPFDAIADQISSVALELATTHRGARATATRTGSFGVLPAQVATPLALVLSELLANAVEHAYGGGGGKVHIQVSRSSAGLQMIIADEGAGLPPGFDAAAATGLGLQIVRALVVGELRGTVALRPGPEVGTEAVVAVPAGQLLG